MRFAALSCFSHNRVILSPFIDRPLLTLALFLVLGVVLASGMPGLSIDDDLYVYFSDDDPKLQELEAFEQTYTSEDYVGFVVVPAGGDIFTPRALEAVREVSERAWQLPYSQRVLSLATYQHSESEGDELRVGPLIPVSGEVSDAQAAHARDVVLSSPETLNRYAAIGARATTVFVRLALPTPIDSAVYREVAYAARLIRDDFEREWSDVDLLLSGTVMTNVVLGEAVASDFTTLIPLTVLTIALGLWFLFASAPAMAVTMLVVLLSVTSTMGLYGWLDTVLSSVSGFVPTIVMTIAVADVVHVLVSYSHQLRVGSPKREALLEAMRINLEPIFITSLTTSIGVLGLNFSDSPPYQALGNMVAVGVTFAFLYSVVLVPAVLALLPARWFMRSGRDGVVSGGGRAERMRAFADWVLARRRALLVLFAVLLPVALVGLSGNRLTERWFEYFDDTFEYRQALEIINAEISGVDAIEYSIESGMAEGVNDPVYLDDLDRFADWMREQPNVVNVNSFADIMKRLNRNLHDDDPAWYRLPEDRALAAQYLLLYELSLPQGQGLDSTLDIDRSASRLQVFLTKTDSDELLALEARARAWLAENTTAVTAGSGTGVDVMFAHLNQRNIRAMLKGTAVALALISVVLIVALRSWRVGLISMVPNLVPALLAFALWGVTVGEVNLAVSVVITMSLGIVVDDTVHFLSKYLRARRERGWDAPEAIRYAFETVGVALTITTAVLVAGFALLAVSHFTPTQDTGTMLALTLALALAVDFLLLPAVLVWVDREPGGAPATDSAPAGAVRDGAG